MKFCRSLGDVKRAGDLFVGGTTHEELKDLALSCCQAMTGQKLNIEQSLGLFGERQHDIRRYPELPLQDAANCLGKLSLPGLMQFHKPVNSPIEQPQLICIASVAWREQRQKLAAW